jgi:hypothetical protein
MPVIELLDCQTPDGRHIAQAITALNCWPGPIGCRLPPPQLHHRRSAENRQARKASMINSLELTRRATLLLGAAAFTSFIARNVEAAQDSELSAFGDLKYPPDFEHFDYVNPDAPKGGVFSHVGATRIFNQNLLTFNSLNSFVLRGDAALGMVLTFASSMARRG